MADFRIWWKGEPGWITYGGRSVPMVVQMASESGKSLLISFEALLGGYVAAMPLSWSDEQHEFVCLIAGLPAVLGKDRPEGVPEFGDVVRPLNPLDGEER